MAASQSSTLAQEALSWVLLFSGKTSTFALHWPFCSFFMRIVMVWQDENIHILCNYAFFSHFLFSFSDFLVFYGFCAPHIS